MRRSLSLVLPLSFALAGCPKPATVDSCTPTSQKQAVLDVMRTWYLYPDLLRSVDPADDAAYPTVSSYLYALTADAQAQGLDRGWTYATSYAQTQQYYDQGTSVGFGIGILVRETLTGTRVFISQVFPGSAAADMGFARGDEVVAIGESDATLVDVPTQLTRDEVAAWTGNAVGPSTAGVTRTFRVLTLVGATEVRTMTKRTYGLDPVPEGPVLIPQGDGVPPVGYVALRTFIKRADALLQDAFAQLQAAGVQDVVVDLRYNGGGLISTAQLLSNLLGADRTPADVMFRFENNPAHASQNEQVSFAPPAQAIAPFRIAFITTGASASASEFVPNVLEAYHHQDVALVGAKTYGKPVGQRRFGMQECDLVVYLVSIRLVNAEGDGSYFDGLPDASGHFSGPLCAAEDDLTHPQSDAAEASTAAALQWLATGTCPAPPAAKASAPSAPEAVPAPDVYPESPAPDEAQRNVRGLF